MHPSPVEPTACVVPAGVNPDDGALLGNLMPLDEHRRQGGWFIRPGRLQRDFHHGLLAPIRGLRFHGLTVTDCGDGEGTRSRTDAPTWRTMGGGLAKSGRDRS
jgi:hypothetical protein